MALGPILGGTYPGFSTVQYNPGLLEKQGLTHAPQLACFSNKKRRLEFKRQASIAVINYQYFSNVFLINKHPCTQMTTQRLDPIQSRCQFD